MAKKRARKTTTMLDKLAVAAGARLGQVAARIDTLTKQRNAITNEIQRYARQAEGALRGLAGGTGPSARKARAKRVAKRKSAAKTRRTTRT
jgi:hypothetical protein